jgi:hypothetical protein
MLDISPPTAGELADELTYGTGGRNDVKFDHRTGMATNGSRPLTASAEYYRNGRWPESTNMPSPVWKSTLPPSLGASSVAWNHSVDTGSRQHRDRDQEQVAAFRTFLFSTNPCTRHSGQDN